MARSTEATRYFVECVAHLATVHVDNCFHRLRLGQSLAEWFCMDPVRARDVSMSGCEVSGQMVEDDEWIHACVVALSMGFSWPFHFAQSVNERPLLDAEGTQKVSVVNDRAQTCVLDISNSGRIFGYVYVVNFGRLSLDLRRAQEELRSLQNEIGLRVSERTCRLHSDMCLERLSLGPTCHESTSPSQRWWWQRTRARRCFVELTECRDWNHCGNILDVR